MKKIEKIFIIGLVIWLLLQLSRFIAFGLIEDINAGAEVGAWYYPAVLDLVAVVFAIPLSIVALKYRGLTSWSLIVIYLAISIVDHMGNLVTTAVVGPPAIMDDFENMSPSTVPVIQTILDIVFLVLLHVPRFRKLFFTTNKDTK